MLKRPVPPKSHNAETRAVLGLTALCLTIATLVLASTFLPRMHGQNALRDNWQGPLAAKLVAPASFHSTRWVGQPPVSTPPSSQEGSFILSPLLADGLEAQP